MSDQLVKAYKAFDPNWKCRDFQYEVGASYETEKSVMCETGFHACDVPLNTWNYYPPKAGSKHAEVELSGDISSQEDKQCASKIKISVGLSLGELLKAQVSWVFSRAAATTGNRAHSATTGYAAHSATTGYAAHSATTGDRAHSATTGKNTVASAVGINSTASSAKGWIVLAEYDSEYNIINVRAGRVGADIEAGKTYCLKNNEFIEAE